MASVDERLYEPVGTGVVAFLLFQLVQLEVVDVGFEQAFVKVAVAQLLQLAQQQVFHFVQRLSGFGASGHQEGAVVAHGHGIAVGKQCLLLLRQVEVDEAGLSVVQYLRYDLQGFDVLAGCAGESPCQAYVLGLGTEHFAYDGRGDRRFLGQVELGQIGVGLHVAEVFVDGGNHLVGIEVTAEADGHVVGHVPRLEVVLDVGDGRILQVFLCTQHGLCAVGVMGEEGGEGLFVHLASVLGERHVLFFVYRLQLGVETADHAVLEAVGLNLGPVFHLIAGDVFRVAGHVVAGVGVGAVSSDGGHQLVVFVGDGIF